MRWLLLKDLQILRRSPLVTALLVALPDRDRRPDRLRALARPREAAGRLRQPGPGRTAVLSWAAASSTDRRAETQLCAQVECVDASCGRRRARWSQSGDVLGALILPRDLVDNLNSLKGLTPQPALCASARQRGGPGQGAARRRPDQLADHAGEPEDLPAVVTTAARYLDLIRERRPPRPARPALRLLGLKGRAASSARCAGSSAPRARLRSRSTR